MREGGVVDGFEEDLLGEDGGDDSTDGLDALGNIETDFCVLWGTAESYEWVAGCFEYGDTKADDEVGDEECGERGEDGRRPEDECADAVDAEAGHECRFEAPFTEDNVAEGERGDEVGAVVSGVESDGLTLADTYHELELLVENIEEAVSEAPEKEQDSDEENGKYRFPVAHLRHTPRVLHADKVKDRQTWHSRSCSSRSRVDSPGYAPPCPPHTKDQEL